MKLYTSLTSPFGRKCRIVAHVVGLLERVEVCPVDYKTDAYRALNPLAKVPALECDDGMVLIDSPVIAAYLDSCGGAPDVVYPISPKARWQALALEALADGIMDAGVLIFLENKRRAEHRSEGWLAAQAGKVNAGLDALESHAGDFGHQRTIGILATAAALSWLEYRDIVGDIRRTRPRLGAWLDEIAREPFMVDTAPPPP